MGLKLTFKLYTDEKPVNHSFGDYVSAINYHMRANKLY